MSDDSAVGELIRRASDPAILIEDLGEAIRPVFESLRSVDREGAEAIARRLANEIVDAPTRPDVAGIISLYCGALVERGMGPMVALDPILDRLERQIAPDALAFVEACAQAGEDDPPSPPEEDGPDAGNGDDEPSDPVERYGEKLAALMPTESASFQALEPFGMAAIAMLSRSAEARKGSRSRTSLRALLHRLGGQYGHAGMLWTMMNVLEDELILVVHPGQGQGYRVRISGLANNFQLHTLLADALIGRTSGRSLPGRRPGPAEVAAARDGEIDEEVPPSVGSFNLWTWRGLNPDETLSEPTSLSAQLSANWVWNEGVPADIPLFEGTRVVLLGPPPYERSWDSNRMFPAMAGDLRVERDLTDEETRDLLRRIAAAVPFG